MQCFLLSVVCNHFIGRNNIVFCIFGMAQGKPRVGIFHSRVYLGQWQSDHKLPPGQCSVDWTDLLLPLHHGCHWKAERAPRTTSVVSQGVGMHWECPKGLVKVPIQASWVGPAFCISDEPEVCRVAGLEDTLGKHGSREC